MENASAALAGVQHVHRLGWQDPFTQIPQPGGGGGMMLELGEIAKLQSQSEQQY